MIKLRGRLRVDCGQRRRFQVISGGKVGGDVSEEEAKKGIKRRKISEAKVEPNSSCSHTSKDAEGSSWWVSSAIEVVRGNARDRGMTSRDLNLNLGNVLSNIRRERAVARKPANICWHVDLSCRPMGNDGNIIMDKGVVAEKLDLDGK